MPFEKVSKSSTSSTADPMISLRKSGSIGINSSALEEYFSEDTEYAEIYYDEEENKIGIKPSDDTGDSYTLSRSSSGGSLTPSAFLKTYDLVPEVTTQYEPYIESLSGDIELVTIDLDDPLKTYGSPDEENEEKKESQSE